MNLKDHNTLPALDLSVPTDVETATLAMGCFWSPEALFGAQTGVYRTRVGYAGGTTSEPTYRDFGSYIETVQVEFSRTAISFSALLELFFRHHTPVNEPRKRQYASALFYHSAAQKETIEKAMKETEERLGKKLKTEVLPYGGFYLAEDRHQKWKLRRVPQLMAEFSALYPDFEEFNNSTAVARANGLVAGFGTPEDALQNLAGLGLTYPTQNLLLNQYQLQQRINEGSNSSC